MANKLYCEGCGQPTEYSLSKPKFCAHCGSGFEVTVARASCSSPAPARVPVRPPRQEAPPTRRAVASYEDEDDDYEEGYFEAPRKLEVSIEVETGDKLNRIPAHALASSGIEPGSPLAAPMRGPVKMTKKQTKERYKEIFGKLNSRTNLRNQPAEDGE